MINYTPPSQLTLEGFKHPFYWHIKQNNLWVKLAEVIPWNELAGIYSENLDPGADRLSVDIRMVIGALIIKHKQKLRDRDMIDMISENVYMQFFCGLKGFQSVPPFDASLFVEICKRMGVDKFDQFNETVIRREESLKPKRKRIINAPLSYDQNKTDDPPGQAAELKESADSSSKKKSPIREN